MPEKFSSGESGDFLKEKYPDLPKSPEVESAVKRQEIREGEEVGNDPREKIGAYLDRLNEIFNPEDADKKERRVDFLKDKLHDKFVIKELPESYFKQQQKIAREQGHGDIEITDQLRQEALKTITADQAQSLDNWVDYLGSSDATYPDWLKYWAFRSITGLSQYDKETHEFKKRSKSTTAPFPDINREALAYVLDAIEKQQKEKKEKKKIETEPKQPTDEEWEKLLKTQNFGKLYAHAIEKITPASEEEKENIQGEWVKYEQGSDAKPLYESLQGHGTGWCTAGESVAKTQLQAGEFHVFYTKDKQGLNKIPRIAIRMQEGEIVEVRGINADQNLEPVMVDIAKERYNKLPGGLKYEKKSNDMKELTEIESKIKKRKEKISKLENELKERGEEEIAAEILLDDTINIDDLEEVELNKKELEFLYEINSEINSFGYKKDPRIEELISTRDKKEDYAKIFNCDIECIALESKDINDETVVLVGDHSFIFESLMPKNLQYILGNVSFVHSHIQDLGKLEFIKGDVDFHKSEVINLGKLRIIGGNAIFQRSKIKDLGQLQSIGGWVSVASEDLDFSNIKVGEDIILD